MPSAEETPMLQFYTPPSSPTEELTTIRSKIAPSSLVGSPLVNELKGVLNVDREEKKKIDSMTVVQLKNYLDSIKVDRSNKTKKQDSRNLAYSTLPKIKLEGTGLSKKRYLRR